MTDKVVSTCASCGARLAESSENCPLCGWIVGVEDHDLRLSDADAIAEPASPADTSSTDQSEEAAPESESKSVFCHSCGWENPAEANFCSACGTKLQKVSRPKAVKKASPPPDLKPKEKPVTETANAEQVDEPVTQKASGMQVTMLVTASFLIVAALYMITVFSKRAFPTTDPVQEQQQQAQVATDGVEAPPLSPAMEEQVQALTAEAASLTGDAQVNKKREIIAVLMSAQRFDRAASVQEEIAEATGTPEDWFQTGHFYYDWMDQLSGAQRPATAQRAVAAYEQGLTMSEDLNVRTALAMAYLNTNTPMLGVTQIRQVLDQEPDHLQGNFYFGVMLMQISRLEQAQAQFERVKELVGPSDPMYEQADIMLNNLSTLMQ